MKQKQQKEPVVTMPKGKLCSDHCRDCTYFDTSRPEASGSGYYRCAKRGSYHSGDECACSSFVRG